MERRTTIIYSIYVGRYYSYVQYVSILYVACKLSVVLGFAMSNPHPYIGNTCVLFSDGFSFTKIPHTTKNSPMPYKNPSFHTKKSLIPYKNPSHQISCRFITRESLEGIVRRYKATINRDIRRDRSILPDRILSGLDSSCSCLPHTP
uniref:Uncharacterized protein n=1 Tax=Cacopsylla melanoneura TaxID=428564 RepID=A0A8D9EB06_9HEMI